MADVIKDISKLKVADLKRELKSRNLSTVGHKQELQDRLQTALQEDNSLLDDTNALGDNDDILNEDDVLAEDEDDSDTGNTNPIPDGSTLKRHLEEFDVISVTSTPPQKSSQAENNGPPAKKVTLNRKVAIVPASPAKTSISLKEEAKKPIAAVGEQVKKVANVSALSMKERFEIRAARFGVSEPLTDAAKKEARAARFGSSSVTANTVPEVSAEVLKRRAERFGIEPGSKVEKIEMEERKKKRLERFNQSSNGNVSNPPKVAQPATQQKPTTTSGRVAITAPSTNSDLEAKRRIRAERFKTAAPIK